MTWIMTKKHNNDKKWNKTIKTTYKWYNNINDDKRMTMMTILMTIMTK